MSRNYTQLRAFVLLDELVVELYVLSRLLPDSELYGLQAQMRRAAVSAPTNIVEGSVRRSDKAYLVFLETALGSASEVRYLLGLAVRLGFLKLTDVSPLESRYSEAIRSLQKLISRIEMDRQNSKRSGRKPKAETPNR